MKKLVVEIKYEMTLSYDEDSVEFKRALDDYNAAIDKDATPLSMLLNVAVSIQNSGSGRMVEGVGYVMHNDYVEDESLYSGIEVEDDDPMPEVDILEHE
jgi:hypothetical protein